MNIPEQIAFARLAPAALAFARAAGLAWSAPGLATPGLGWRLRVGLAGLLAFLIAPGVAWSGASVGALGAACAGEVLVGALLGWSAALVVAGARQAGEVVGAQAGFATASLLDPEAGDEMTGLGHLYGLVALAVFVALDGPLGLTRALIASYRVVPPGGGALTDATAALAFGRVGGALALSLRAAAPAAVAVATAGLALGLWGKAAPTLQGLALSMPLRSALGLVLVLLGLAALASSVDAEWSAFFRSLTPILEPPDPSPHV